ncbi:MAG: DUF285 domain-containing protein [Muribaculaceae bacterium]|nr:DUF285 domain-containing protein [Muribaculaceae bacterium]
MEYDKSTALQEYPFLDDKIAGFLTRLISDLPVPVGNDLKSALESPSLTIPTVAQQSRSYVIIACSGNANPTYNEIILRNSTVSINLKPGINILTVEQYPDLKYGFHPTMVRRGMLPNENCQAVIEVDLSHFDTSEVESTESMFDDMFALRKVNLSNVKFCNVRKMDNMFARCFSLKEIVINDIRTFKSDVLTSANGMFLSTASIRSLGLGNFGGSKLKEIIWMFASMDSLEELDLSGWDVRGKRIGTNDEPLFHGCGNLKKIYMFGCNDYTVKKVRQELESSAGVPNNVKIRRIVLTGAKIIMNDISKKKAINQWLASNPGKTERDWLLDVRCTTDTQREALLELLECCDACGMKYEVCHEVDLDEVYSNLIASDSYLQEILELRVMEKYNNFNGYCAEVFEDDGIEYIQHHTFDLYFPHIGWYINIGSEIEDATMPRWTQQTGPTHSEKTGFVEISKAHAFMTRFHEKLNAQYRFPKSSKFPHTVEGCYYAFFPWNKDVESEVKKSSLNGEKLLFSSVGQFWATLFKDNFNAMKSFRKERYLRNHPDVMESRLAMLHSLVTEVQKGLGLNKTVSPTQLNKLLETVDNELSIIHPEYEEIHHLRQACL